MPETRKVIVDGVEFEVTIEGEGKTWTATVHGKSFEIEILMLPCCKEKRSGGGKKKSGTVSANIPGKVVTVEVKEGQQN